MVCGRCRSADLDRDGVRARCAECGVALRVRPAAWLPMLCVIAAVVALPPTPLVLAAALPALIAAIAWGESLAPAGEPTSPTSLPPARLR